MTDDLVDQMRVAIASTMTQFPNTQATQSALIAVMLWFSSELAKRSPPEVRRHWAQAFYEHADQLSAPDDREDG